MEKKGLILLLVAVILTATIGTVLAECKPPTGYPTIDAWRLAGCQNDWERTYGAYGYPYEDSPYGRAQGYSSNNYGQGYPYNSNGAAIQSFSGGITIVIPPPLLPPRWRHHR